MIVLALLLVAPSANRLQLAMAMCQPGAVERLLQEGADANARDAHGPILRWLASGRKCTDAGALATAQVLVAHGARFDTPGLLTNLAPRRLPGTLALLAQQRGTGDPTQALRAIARGDDVASVRVLLEAGADPLAGVALSSALFDATASGRAASVREMLSRVADKQSRKVLAAYEIAKKHGNEEIAQIFLAAGMQPPPAPPPPSCQPRELAADEAGLMSRIGLPAQGCKLIERCGDLLLVDCNSAADGPAYYLNAATAQRVATCGGACMRGCTNCPPQGWTCACRR